MQADTDAGLLSACRAGDQDAWEALIRRYQRLIYAIPVRAGLSADSAAEVFQRVCVTLMEHLDRIEQPERLGAWITTTARRESLRQLRLDRRQISLPEEDDDVTPDAAPLPDEVLERLEQQQALSTAMSAMDERCRALLLLLFYRPDPAPYADIAAQLDLPMGSIGPMRSRCLKKLRKLLEPLGL